MRLTWPAGWIVTPWISPYTPEAEEEEEEAEGDDDDDDSDDDEV